MIKNIKIIIKKIIATYNLKKSLIKSKSKKIIYIGSPLHGNIGDHAISIAIMDILKKTNIPIVEIPGERYMLACNRVINYVKKEDIIVLTGGGLIGNLWLNEEEMVKSVISNFKNNKIIVMPHTFYFDDCNEGKKELEELKNLINAHGNVSIAAREENTFEFCKNHFSNAHNIVYLPDVVLTLDYSNEHNRRGILFVLREDKEKLNSLEKLINKFPNDSVNITTTVLDRRISIAERRAVLESKLVEFQNVKLVVTDRLHGMIFAAITGTPCIAFDNKSKKISGVYKWINKLSYIKFCDTLDKFDFYLKEINSNYNYTYNLAKDYQEQILNFLKDFL